MLDSVYIKLNNSKLTIDSIKNPDANNQLIINQTKKSINDLFEQYYEQEKWLNSYLSKNKASRKLMFYEKP